MSPPRSDLTCAVLEVFARQSVPVPWRFVAEELARRGTIGAALAPGDLRIVRWTVGNCCRSGELVRDGSARLPGRTGQPAGTYRLRREGEGDDEKARQLRTRAEALADALKAWNAWNAPAGAAARD